jgi:hypothetical protein
MSRSETGHWRSCSELTLCLRFFDAGLGATLQLELCVARVGKLSSRSLIITHPMLNLYQFI